MGETLTIDDRYRERLAAAGLERFDALLRADVGEVVTRRKDRETRRVIVGVGEDRETLYIKRCFSIGPKHAFWPRFLMRPCHTPPIKEAKAIAMCRAAGIPTVDVVASGEMRRVGIPSAGFVVMTAAPMAWTLNDWLTIGYERDRRLEDHERVALLRAVGDLLGRIAMADIDWPDCKAKHIHAAPGEDGDWRLAVIDLERARRIEGFGGDFTSCYSAVSRLLPSLTPSTLRHEDLIAFWTAALPYMDAVSKAKVVDRETTVSMISFGSEASPRLDEAFEHPNRLPMTRVGGMRVDPRYVDLLRDAGLSKYDDVMSSAVGASMNKPGLASYRERIRLTLGAGDRAETVYLKRYRRPPLKEQLRRMWEFRFRRGSAEREMHFARHLGLLGVNTMRRIALGSRMRGWLEQSGFGITGEVPGESLETLVDHWSSQAAAVPTPSERRDLIEQLANVAFRLHNNGLFHRDLYLCHVFMSRREDGAIVLSVIDLGRMIRSAVRAERWRIKDLAALAYSSPAPLVTRADRVRFLYHYARLETRGDRQAVRKRARGLVASIEARTRRTARHDESRRRRLQTA
ncbi:MAG TPA: lipopolysaccharide kinase InaA family protein [Phycisphaerae bacterium]|nr:lipopolysaccharide kinase InaA family protein [Phycisphaerae bacterium]HRW52932.1 lipopolysaccharide kinase InaA family protein [Phycisphaerae bacterium]